MIRAQSEYLTTGQAARLLGCSPGTVAKLLDQGRIPSHRLPSCAKPHRRIRRADLAAWLQSTGHPAAAELSAQRTVLCCGTAAAAPGWSCVPCVCPAAAGAAFAADSPAAAVIDAAAWGPGAALPLAAWLLRQAPRPRVLLVSPEDVPAADLAARCPGSEAVGGPLTHEALTRWLSGG